jgi:mannonate dehydratase
VPKFRETFLGEGNYDPFLVMRRLLEVGYRGLIIEDHYPVLDGDVGTADGVLRAVRAKTHAIGTLQGLLRAAQSSLEEQRPAVDSHAAR